jgi:hypothetical protein
MKNKREIDRRANARAPTEKLNFTKHSVGFWQDLEDNQHWKYAEFFWSRRPRLLPATGYIVWIISALGLTIRLN